MVLATWWGLANLPSILLAILLAFVFGYSLTLIPLVRAGTALGAAVGIALVADTFSIATMELVDTPSCSCGPARSTPASRTCCSGARSRSRSPSRGGRRSSSTAPSSDAGRDTREPTRRMATSEVVSAGPGPGTRIRDRREDGSTCERRCSKAGGRTSDSPRWSGSSSTEKPGPSVASSKRTPLGSRK